MRVELKRMRKKSVVPTNQASERVVDGKQETSSVELRMLKECCKKRINSSVTII